MKSELILIAEQYEFPCLMEYRMQGELLAGIYLVSEDKGEEGGYNVCCVKTGIENITELGSIYYKKTLDIKEWLYMPKGTKVTLTN